MRINRNIKDKGGIGAESGPEVDPRVSDPARIGRQRKNNSTQANDNAQLPEVS